MSDYFNNNFPDVTDLKRHAKKRIPKFSFNYFEGGCMEGVGVQRNRADIEAVQLRNELLKPFSGSDLSVELLGHKYSAPFGIAPAGLQGSTWPKSPEILAKTAAIKNIPYILSTVSSSSLERIAEVSEGKAWFQLYNPTGNVIRQALLSRITAAQYRVLVITVDMLTFGLRPRDIRNSLAMPPKMTISNILQMLSCPQWLMATALNEVPEIETLKPYIPKGMPTDQLDAGESPVKPLQRISKKYCNKIKIFMDSRLQSGTYIASTLASGADFTFLGHSFIYGVGALGNEGGIHTINLPHCS